MFGCKAVNCVWLTITFLPGMILFPAVNTIIGMPKELDTTDAVLNPLFPLGTFSGILHYCVE
jgi:hypothetical protein